MTAPTTALPALPSDWRSATLLGRAWIPGNLAGPSPITVRPDGTVIDLAPICPTVSMFLEQDDAAAAVRALAAMAWYGEYVAAQDDPPPRRRGNEDPR